MKTTTVLLLFTLASVALSHPPHHAEPEAVEGEPCTPYVPVHCGEAELVNEEVTQAGDSFGPYVCIVNRTYTVPTYTYQYKKFCHGWKKQFCYTACLNTKDCNDTKSFSKLHVECCEGFTGNATATDIEYFSKYYGYPGTPTKKTLKNEGCPREIQSTVQDCLLELGLISLADMFQASELSRILTSAESKVTVFAPSEDILRSSFGGKEPDSVLGTHIVDSVIPAAFLGNGQRLETLSNGLFLHISEVDSKGGEAIFVNGIELTMRDACVADNGIVHKIDGLILSEKRTLAEVIADTEELSTFNSLITAVGLNELLNGSKLLTVFAPVNEAFDELELEYTGFIDCLLREENKAVLKKLLLKHISKRAEYSASLALRDFVVTKHCYKVKYHHFFYHFHYYPKCSKLQIQVENDSILVGDDGAQVIQPDIPASNGVIHFISEPLSASKLDLEELCPTTPAPEGTEAPTRPEGTTTAPMETEAPTRPEDGGEVIA